MGTWRGLGSSHRALGLGQDEGAHLPMFLGVSSGVKKNFLQFTLKENAKTLPLVGN